MKNNYISCQTCYIKQCTILKNCNSDFLDYIDKRKIIIRFKAGSPVILADAAIDGIYIVYTGLVKLSVKGFKQRPFILRIAGPGSIIGHTPDDENRQHVEVSAVENTELCLIKENDLQLAIASCKGIRSALIEQFRNEIKVMQQRTIRLLQMNVREKIIDGLIHIADAYQMHNNTTYKINISRQDIADLTGTAKEQVSKIISDLKKEDLIEISGKNILIKQIAQLKKSIGYVSENLISAF